jgi:hypothetical protein
MRGRSFLIFLIGLLFFDYVLYEAVKSKIVRSITSLGADTSAGAGAAGTAAVLGILFGLGYYAIAYLLDRKGKHGPATGLVYTAFIATAGGVFASGKDLHVSGAAVLGLVLGAVIAWYGGRFGRRVTCFAGAGGMVVAVFVLLADNVDSGTTAGILFVVIGAVFIVAAQLLATVLHEPEDMDPSLTVRSR